VALEVFMHYYQFHVGDYLSSTSHLSNEEDLAYRRLLDMYYTSEKPIPLDTQWVSRRLRVATETVESVLRDFFVRTEEGYSKDRCQQEIERFRQLAERNKRNGSLGGRPKNPLGSQSDTSGIPEEPSRNPNHEPITKNQEPSTNVVAPKRRKQLPDDFYPDATGLNAAGQKGVDVAVELQKFRDYHAARGSVMLDWQAAWRTWVGNVRFTTATVSKQSALEARNAEVLRRYLAEKEDV
jgi:uncharacterized protein YdaU (DUF1376 family)